MRQGATTGAKLVVTVLSNRKTKRIRTISVHDNRTDRDWTDAQITERGIWKFIDTADLKATLNWNLNGDPDRYCLQWGQSGKTDTVGYAYIFQP
ncbi:hypothetical protein NE634_14660 [Lacrimispora saccharolytica]|nr:hypothetical protein [Lacrimispora saccharolytica]